MLTGNLEYIISSLPNLSFSDSEALQHEVKSLFQKYALADEASNDLISILNEEAAKYLSGNALQIFQNVHLSSIHQNEFQKNRVHVVSEFSIYMFQLKNELKHFRIARLTDEMSTKTNYELIAELSDNPLEAELQLMQLQWQKLESLSIGHYADLSALILYKLKLEVLLRWWSFDTEEGFNVFQKTLTIA